LTELPFGPKDSDFLSVPFDEVDEIDVLLEDSLSCTRKVLRNQGAQTKVAELKRSILGAYPESGDAQDAAELLLLQCWTAKVDKKI